MALFAIADPHLSFGVDKPMHIFGSHWHEHERRLAENWLERVSSTDTVLIPGDISWAMQLDDALPDLKFLHDLPGQKILSRGNHDYWWTSLNKVEMLCRENQLDSIRFLRNNAYRIEPGWVICGSRGWILPDDPDFKSEDEKIYRREAGRLRLSLEAARKIRMPGDKLVACLHYPPYSQSLQDTLFTELIDQFEADLCVFGHIHGNSSLAQSPGPVGRARYKLVAADFLGFSPLAIEL